MNKTRICHLTSVHPWADTRILYRECASLANHGYEVHLIVANQQPGEFPGVRIHAVQAPARNRLTRMWATTQAVFQKALEVDAAIYHFHDPELIPIGRKLQRKGKKVIYDVHEHVPNQIRTKYYIPALLRPVIATAFDLFEKWMAGKMDGVVTAVDTVRDRLQPVNPLTVDINNYPEANMMYVEEDWSKKTRDVIYVGLINEIRGIRELIASLALPGTWKLSLVGTFGSSGLEAELARHPDWDRVDYLGQQPRKTVADLMAASRIGIVTFLPAPNHNKNQPNKLFEYMAAGIPVVCSDFPRWKKLVEDRGCGLCVDPADPAAIAGAVEYLLAHPDEARAMGQRGREAMESTYNWASEERKLVDLYQKILGA
ncbi:MAG: glycosyltransferase family 4 protein [Lewinellaceae bacterium]|nr:glycosyltransferase family 4 protein [Lewinellaceae bacterium]